MLNLSTLNTHDTSDTPNTHDTSDTLIIPNHDSL